MTRFVRPDYRSIGTVQAENLPNGYLFQETAEDIIERGKEAQRIARERAAVSAPADPDDDE